MNKLKLKDWINEPSRGEDGFSALHFATFHGNLNIIKILVYYGGNIFIKNKLDINMLHIAA